MKKSKVVYQDADYAKVVYGTVDEDNDFVIVTNSFGKQTKIGKKFIVSVSDMDD